jgi:DNA polymerase-3 subunit epsilon
MFEQALDRPLAEIPLVVLDTETTGLHPGLGDRVVEVAAVRFEGWQETGRFNRLVNPERRMSAKASEVCGIVDADLVDQPSFATFLPELLPLLDGAVLVAHNAVFDAGFVGMELHLASQQPLEPRTPVLANPWLCTLLLARRHFHFGRNSLDAISRSLGVRRGRAHRALNDVYTTANVLKRMAHELSRRRLESAADLLHAQGEPIFTPPPPDVELPPLIAAAMAARRPLQVLYLGAASPSEMVVEPRYAARYRGVPQLIVYEPERDELLALQLDLIFRANPA